MKKLNTLIIFSILAIGFNAQAKTTQILKLSDIKAIQLLSGEMIKAKQIERIQFAQDRKNKIDYIELYEGSLIDSYDINKAILKKEKPNLSIDPSILNSTYMFSRHFGLGDGSGG